METSRIGKGNPAWKGGQIKKIRYPPEFSASFRASIRDRDQHKCFLCGAMENGRAHDVHHINYTPDDSSRMNCMTLCRSCHVKTNYDREKWQEMLEKKMQEAYNVVT